VNKCIPNVTVERNEPDKYRLRNELIRSALEAAMRRVRAANDSSAVFAPVAGLVFWIIAADERSEEGAPGEDPSSPGILADSIARGSVVRMGHRCPAVKHECPAPRRSAGPRRCPFVLDSPPGTWLALSVWRTALDIHQIRREIQQQASTANR